MIAEETSAQLEPPGSGSPIPRRILIIDDDECQVAALEHRLSNLGFNVRAAFTGRQGLDVALHDPFDLIVLDLRLPDIEGLEVCARLADAPQTCAIPIIILSGMERPDIVRRSREAGCEYYVRKPYDPNVLLTLIEQALGKSSSMDW